MTGGPEIGEPARAAAVLTQDGAADPVNSDNSDEDDLDEEEHYLATHYDGQLPAPTGVVAKAVQAKLSPEDQRAQAGDFFEFILSMQSDLRDLNGDDKFFTALVSVPDTNKVKVIYGLGIGTAGIGQVSAVAGKLLALFGEGGGALGPAQSIMLEATIRNQVEIKNITTEEVAVVFRGGAHVVDRPVMKAQAVQGTENTVMKIAPIPAYLVWDGFDKDLDAAMIYERLMDCQHESPMKTHALLFLRSCMIGGWRLNDTKPFLPATQFYAMLPAEARLWGAQRFSRLLPDIGRPAPITPERGIPVLAQQIQPQQTIGGATGGFQIDQATLQQLLQAATTQGANALNTVTPEKRDDGSFKVSEGEKVRMRTMCGLPDDAGDECFPKWFRDIFGKHMDDVTRAQLVASAVEKGFIIDDAEVALHPELTKTIIKRDWTGSDLGKRAALVNAAKGNSPFACVDLTEEDVAEMTQDYEDLLHASAVSTADYKAARVKLKARTPTSSEGFMLMLKRFTNLQFALFSSQSPLYVQMYGIVQALRDYSPNARSKLTHEVKTCILWIILLQSRRFSQGKMEGPNACLGEFTNMVNLIKAKNCETITHVEVPTELLSPAATKRQVETMAKRQVVEEGEAPGGTKKKQKTRVNHPYSKELAEFFKKPYLAAGQPSLNSMCAYSGVTQEQLVPNLARNECRSWIIMGKCMFGDKCKFQHRTATKDEVESITTKLKRFKNDPLGCKKGGETK